MGQGISKIHIDIFIWENVDISSRKLTQEHSKMPMGCNEFSVDFAKKKVYVVHVNY